MTTLKFYTPNLMAVRYTGDNAQDVIDVFGGNFFVENGVLYHKNSWGDQLVPVNYIVCDALHG